MVDNSVRVRAKTRAQHMPRNPGSARRLRVLLRYLLAWGLVLVFIFFFFSWIYPYRLRNTGPDIVAYWRSILPTLVDRLPVQDAPIHSGVSAEVLRETLAVRERNWRIYTFALMSLGIFLTFTLQLFWRRTNRSAILLSRRAQRVVRRYRVTMLVIVVCNALLAGLLYWSGVHHIAEPTLWDLSYAGSFVLSIVAAWYLFRMAAPPGISGKNCFFGY